MISRSAAKLSWSNYFHLSKELAVCGECCWGGGVLSGGGVICRSQRNEGHEPACCLHAESMAATVCVSAGAGKRGADIMAREARGG